MKQERSAHTRYGVEIPSFYITACGETRLIDSAVRERLLNIMERHGQLAPACAPLPPAAVFRAGQPPILETGAPHAAWRLILETGASLDGHADADGRILLSADLPPGYHLLECAGEESACRCRLIIAPPSCLEPELIRRGGNGWGVCVQLYTLRSERNWGVGDFGDLMQLCRHVAAQGGVFIGLNPLHALFPALPENASPYSPSSRRWLNSVYIDVNAVPEFQESRAARAWFVSEEVRERLRQARETDWVNYTLVTELKLEALRLAFAHFEKTPATGERRIAFERFLDQGGKDLAQQATFDALQGRLNAEGSQWRGWQTWPEEFRDATGTKVRDFQRRHAAEVRFYAWLQWLAAVQLEQCATLCRELGMPIGLYRDLAVGTAADGAETWTDTHLYCLEATLGVPPDPFGPLGQEWGLPPVGPTTLLSRSYQPFTDLVRHNMAQAGALRIDHVMTLFRLWWIPQGETPYNGAYVHYPLEDLLAVLALESHRSGCLVIGEDLGIIPSEVVATLQENNVYSCKVLYFEQDGRSFRPPQAYPRRALATLATHDLPTFASYWQSEDLDLASKLGLCPDEHLLAAKYAERETVKQALFRALQEQGLLEEDLGYDEAKLRTGASLNVAVHRFLARSASALVGVQLEDALHMNTPVNVPGTCLEYPNWRRKLSLPLEEIFQDPDVRALLQAVDAERRAVSGSPTPYKGNTNDQAYDGHNSALCAL